jgi:hypothetical protein
MQQATSDDVFFELNSLNTLSVWILRWTLEASVTTTDESNFVKANQNQLNARSRDGQSTESSPTSTGKIKDTGEYYRQHGVSTYLALSSKQVELDFDKSSAWVASNKTA